MAKIGEFITKTAGCKNISFEGIQFHSSWNMNPDNQIEIIKRIAEHLSGLDATDRSRLKFLDIGGGYWPPLGEWLHNDPAAGHEQPIMRIDNGPKVPIHFCVPADSLDNFAEKLGAAIKKYILPLADLTVFTEPGRWVCHDAMHILIQVVDKKDDNLVIVDAGTNAIGWERFESDYFPVINLSRPSLEEKPCHILGSLCTPHDVWGFSYFGSGMEPGDVLLIPSQGAYTYSLRQNFIKKLPIVTLMGEKRNHSQIKKEQCAGCESR